MAATNTLDRSLTSLFPVVWTMANIVQNTNGAISIVGQIDTVPINVRSSVVAMLVKLSTPLTAGTLNLRITKDGTPIGGGANVLMDNTDPDWAIKRFKPGEVIVGKAKHLGVNFNADATMEPSGTLDALVYFVIQPVDG